MILVNPISKTMATNDTHFSSPDTRMQTLMRGILRGDLVSEVIRSRSDRQLLRTAANCSQGSSDLFVKVYRHTTWISRLKARLALTGGLHDWRVCSRLAHAGLPVPEPLGKMYRGKGASLPCTTLFVQIWADNSRPLSQMLKMKIASEQMACYWVERVLNRIGELMAIMHLHGFIPRDWHPGNLLLQETAPEQFQILLIDYESIRYRRWALKSRVHLSLGQICSYMNAFAPKAHELLADGYRRTWPYKTPEDLAARIQRVAREHFESRQKRIDCAFNQISTVRRKTREIEDD